MFLRREMKKLIILSILAGIVSVGNAQVFTTATAFQMAIASDPGQYLNTFGSNAANWSGGTPTMAYTMSATNGLYSNGNFLGTISSNEALLMTFTSGNVRAVGGSYYTTSLSDVFQPGSTINITYSDGGTDSYIAGSTSQFRGYVSGTVLTSMSITSTGPDLSRWASMDNVVTSTVPEPATMTALALGALALLRKRKSA